MAEDLDLVGATEIAEMLGLSRQRVNQLAGQPGFPAPVGQLRQARIWRRQEVETWARDTGRLPQRRPSEQ